MKDREIHGESDVWSTDSERSKDLMLMSGLSETTDHLATANSVPPIWSCVEERG